MRWRRVRPSIFPRVPKKQSLMILLPESSESSHSSSVQSCAFVLDGRCRSLPLQHAQESLAGKLTQPSCLWGRPSESILLEGAVKPGYRASEDGDLRRRGGARARVASTSRKKPIWSMVKAQDGRS